MTNVKKTSKRSFLSSVISFLSSRRRGGPRLPLPPLHESHLSLTLSITSITSIKLTPHTMPFPDLSRYRPPVHV